MKQCNIADNELKRTKKHLDNLVEWIRQQGGKFNPKAEIMIFNNDNGSGLPRTSVIAKEEIVEGEVIIDIPPQCFFTKGMPNIGDDVLVHSDRPAIIISVNPDFTFDVDFENEEEEDDLNLNSIYNLNGQNVMCDVINSFIEEIKLGNSSRFAPYINYILDETSMKKSPKSWSNDGKMLLQEILNDELPPYNIMNKSWDFKCQNIWNRKDYLSTIKLPYDLGHVLFPALGMINHANGNILNTNATKFDFDEGFSIEASRNINAGEEIYHSYNLGN